MSAEKSYHTSDKDKLVAYLSRHDKELDDLLDRIFGELDYFFLVKGEYFGPVICVRILRFISARIEEMVPWMRVFRSKEYPSGE